MTAITLWSVKLEPGKPHAFTLFDDEDTDSVILRLTNASLGLEVADENARTALKLTHTIVAGPGPDEDDEDDDEEGPGVQDTIVCVLTPGKVDQAQLSLECGRELLQLEAIGKNDIYLTGFIVDQDLDQGPGDSEFDSDDEPAFHLDEVSSDVEFSAEDAELDDDDADRFEEVDDEKKSLKRGADAMDEDGAPSTGSNGLSKKQQKKLSKKLKTEDGKAVAPASTASAKSDAAGAKPESKKEKGDKKEKEKKDDKEKKDKSAGAAKKALPGGLIVQDTKVGEGKESKKGDTLGMRYIGKLENGKVFDSNKGGAPFTFRLGAGEVIKGWDQGLIGMKVGGERVLTVPAPLAYGKKGSKPDIPPNATLRFEVKLIDLK